MTKRIFASPEIPMDVFDATHCIIEVDNSDPLYTFQRHIWKKKGSGKWEPEKWIRSIRFDEEKSLKAGWKLLPQENTSKRGIDIYDEWMNISKVFGED